MAKAFPRWLAAVLSAATLVAIAAGNAAAATTALECGIFRDYTAPDPVGVVAGSITFGLSGSPETIAADATLVPPADTALPGLQGGAPTCLTVVRDAGVITSLEFAASGTVSGSVVLVPDLFGPGQDAYVIADRIFTPASLIASNDGLAALIKTAADSGATLSITFQIDLATGVPTGFDAETTVSGAVSLPPGGDIQVGSATLPSSVIDASARTSLGTAADLGVSATVVIDGLGTLIQSGQGGVSVDISLTVSFVAPAESSPGVSDTAVMVGAATSNAAWAVLAPLIGVLLGFLPALGYLRRWTGARASPAGISTHSDA